MQTSNLILRRRASGLEEIRLRLIARIWNPPSRPRAGTQDEGRTGTGRAGAARTPYSAASLRSSRGSGNTMSSTTVETVSTVTS